MMDRLFDFLFNVLFYSIICFYYFEFLSEVWGAKGPRNFSPSTSSLPDPFSADSMEPGRAWPGHSGRYFKLRGFKAPSVINADSRAEPSTLK